MAIYANKIFPSFHTIRQHCFRCQCFLPGESDFYGKIKMQNSDNVPFFLLILLGCSPGALNSTDLKLDSYYPQPSQFLSFVSLYPFHNLSEMVLLLSTLDWINLNSFSTSDQHSTSTGNEYWLFYFFSLNSVHFSSFILPVMQ